MCLSTCSKPSPRKVRPRRASGVAYTIIRPGRLVDEPMEEPRAIERRFVARAMVDAMERPETKDAIYELSQARLAVAGADPIFGLKVSPPAA